MVRHARVVSLSANPLARIAVVSPIRLRLKAKTANELRGFGERTEARLFSSQPISKTFPSIILVDLGGMPWEICWLLA
jgi:hypothetical protein